MDAPLRFKKKPVEVEAWQVSDEGVEAILAWMTSEPGETDAKVINDELLICTLEGEMKASVGDWVVKGIAGEFYPCRSDIFAQTYESADTPATCFHVGPFDKIGGPRLTAQLCHACGATTAGLTAGLV